MKKLYSNIKFITLGVLSVTAINGFSANYNIAFTATGAISTVANVIVENTTQSTTVTVPAGNVLNLTNVITAVQQVDTDNEEINCKTDMQGITTLSFNVKQAGLVQINAFNLDGRKIVGMSNQSLTGQCTYKLTLPQGMYLLQVQGNAFKYTSKLNVAKSENSKVQLSYIGTEKTKKVVLKAKSYTQGVTQMLYTDGDQLIFKGYSGNYANYVPFVPTTDATINFNFVDCTDADGNHYATVSIGSQVWMAENLKTTKFNDGTEIPIQIPTANSASCYYSRLDPLTKDAMGLLYKWQALNPASNGGRYLTPAGWHVPTYTELEALCTQVGNNNMWSQMRTTDWTTANAAIGNNATGFSFKQAGYGWDNLWSGEWTAFWSSDSDANGNPYALVFHSNDINYHLISYSKATVSCPIRCLKDY